MKKISLTPIVLSAFVFCGCSFSSSIKTDKNEKNKAEDTSVNITANREIVTVNDDMPCVSDYSQFDNKSYGFGYRKDKKGIVPSIGIYSEYFKGKNAYYTGNTNEKKIFLTFDEGYENGYTGKILDTLKEKQVPAAFFCTGDYLKKNDDLICRMIDEGHIIGNHTWNHPSMPGICDDEKFKSELTLFDDYLNEKHGIKTKFFRYPSGEFSQRSLEMIKDMGYTTVFWSLAYKDWERDVSHGSAYAVSEVSEHIHNGAIILLHAVSKDNADALPAIIDALKQENYKFVSLNELK